MSRCRAWIALALLGCGQTTEDRVAPATGGGPVVSEPATGGSGGTTGDAGAADAGHVVPCAELPPDAPHTKLEQTPSEGGPPLFRLWPRVIQLDGAPALRTVSGFSSPMVFPAGAGIWHVVGCRAERVQDGEYYDSCGPVDSRVWFVGTRIVSYHYAEQSWGELALAAEMGTLHGVWAAWSGSVWVTGQLGATELQAVWRWDGTRWHGVVRGLAPEAPYSILGRSDMEVYIGRTDDLLRWDGSALTSIAAVGCRGSTGPPHTSDLWLGPCSINLDGEVSRVAVSGLWGDVTDLWFVHEAGVGRHNGTGSVDVDLGGVPTPLRDVWGSTTANVWVAGDSGVVINYTTVAPDGI